MKLIPDYKALQAKEGDPLDILEESYELVRNNKSNFKFALANAQSGLIDALKYYPDDPEAILANSMALRICMEWEKGWRSYYGSLIYYRLKNWRGYSKINSRYADCKI